MNPIPKLLDAIDSEAYTERLKNDTPTYETNIRGYEIVYRLLDDKPADLVRAIQEQEILKTRVKLRQGARVTTLPSFWEVWHNPDAGLSEELLAHADPNEAKWALSKKYGYKLATTFMPTYAKSIYEYFRSEIVLDPCAGWGDRMLGATVSSCVKKYVGFDPNRALISGSKDIMRQFGHEEKTNESADSVFSFDETHVAFMNDFEIYAEPFEKGILSFPPDSFDFAFTSPPYFDYEDYTPSNPKYKDWFLQFYTPLFKQTCRVLKPSAFFAIHIGDTSAGQIGRFLETVPQITIFRYVSKIGLKGAHSNQIRDVWLFQKR